jgi:hypothetical protein
MKKSFLLPHKFKKSGWVLLFLGLFLGVSMRFFGLDSDYLGRVSFFGFITEKFFTSDRHFFTVVENGFLDELAAVLIILGGVLVGFCKTKIEDEYILNIRLSSLVWAVYVNYGILFLSVLFVFDSPFIDVLIFNMFTVLLFFILRFHILLYKANKI